MIFLVRQSVQLTGLVKEVVEHLGYELWGVVFHPRTRNQTLLVFIDANKGINLDDCAKVSRALSQRLDETDPIQGSYLLEVSSPGLDRPLFNLEQFKKYLNSQVRIEMRTPVNGRRRFVGQLLSVTSEQVSLVKDNQQFELMMHDILKANLIPEID